MNWEDVDMVRRRQRAERVNAGDLTRSEQETAIDFFGDADDAQVTTYAPTLACDLLRHDYARIEWVYAEGVRERLARVVDPSEIRDAEGPVRIGGVCALLPIGALTVKGAPRKRDRLLGIITTPRDLEGLDDVFDTEGDA